MAKVTLVFEDVMKGGEPTLSMSCDSVPPIPKDPPEGFRLTPAQAMGVHSYAVAAEVARAQREAPEDKAATEELCRKLANGEDTKPSDFHGVRK